MSNLQMPAIPTYFAAERAYHKAPRSGHIGHNTVSTREEGGVISIRYLGSPIVRYEPDGTVYVTNAGWPRVTTHRRINLIVGKHCRAHLKARTAYLTVGDTTYPLDDAWIKVAKVTDGRARP